MKPLDSYAYPDQSKGNRTNQSTLREKIFSNCAIWQKKAKCVCTVDILIRKIWLDPINLHGQGAIMNYIPKFKVATMSLEVA